MAWDFLDRARSSRSSSSGCAASSARRSGRSRRSQDEIGQPELDRIGAPLKERVRERGLWAAHLPPELGGQGFGQVKLGLMNEILGTSIYAPPVFGCQAPDSGNSEIIALAGTDEQKERWLFPLLNGEIAPPSR